MFLDDFKNTVDRYSVTISSSDILGACKQLGIDTSRGYTIHQITNKLYEHIKEALKFDKSEQEKISRIKLLKLQSELVYRHVLYGENPVEYLKILKVINDSCRPDADYFPPFSSSSKWEEAIINCKNFNELSPDFSSIPLENIRNNYPKDFDIAISAKQLIGKGCKIEIKDSMIYITSGLEAVVGELNEKIKTMGGLSLAKSLFNHIVSCKKYSMQFERYFITHEPSMLGFDQQPQIPIGFLLNLSLKHPFENLKIKNGQVLLDEIINLAIIIANGAYGVQQYVSFEFIFQSGETIIPFFTDIALWDSIFTIPQCRPSSALDICDSLFSFISDNDFKKSLGFTRPEFIIVLKELNKIVTNVHFPMVVYHSKLCKVLKQINGNAIQVILDLLSHQSTNINEKYILPSDYSSIDFWKKPLIKLGATKFLLMNKSWCAPSYFEAIANPLRESFKSQKKDLDNELGHQLEIFIQEKLSAKGITFKTGDYNVLGVSGECDMLIESENAIILIEFKKKVLTNKAKSGTDFNILIDLSESVLDAQIQTGRTEIILRERGNITLTAKNKSSQTINLNNRRIERIALTQLEFGSFHDRFVFKHLLTTLLKYSFEAHSEDPKITKKFKQLEVKRKKWAEQYSKLCHIDANYPNSPFFNCWFMSLPQLIEVINLSSDNDSFYEIFRRTKHITHNTLDWYREFDSVTKLQYETK
jgi:hypothetical protein